MKTRIILILCALAISALSFTTINQDERTATATYDGYEYEEYNFSIAGGEDEDDTYISFTEVPEEILKSYNLKSEQLIGASFKMTYEIVPEKELENGDFIEEMYVLKSLKQIK